jgi:two-component system cell cycle sensor histidine kinase/response regulator CckA
MSWQGRRYAGRVLPLKGVEGLEWQLCLAVPEHDYLGSTHRMAVILGLIGLAFLALTVWRIHHLAKRLGDPLDALTHSAMALGEGRQPEPVTSNLLEVQTLDEALQKAGHALRKEAEMQLKLEHSQRLETLGTLTGGIAHDVNNQLASVLGQISLAGEHLPQGHPSLYRMHRAEQAVERCAQMLKSLLSFSHQVPPELRAVDLNELVSHTSSLLERVLGGLIRIEVIHSPCLPPILGEPVQLEQVILNLAINSRDAMPEGGKLTLRTLAVGKNQVCLSVEDTGAGIPKEILPQIFDPFFTTKEMGKGTGLGLAMVFGIVQNHGGRIEVDSQEGVGTRFRIFFEAQSAPAPQEPAREAPERSLHSFASVHILVAEDEPNLRELLTEAFSQRGAEVDAAPDGEIAWKKFQRGSYDLVISDQRMPECTGLELLSRIRATQSQVPMILASGFGLEGMMGELAKDPRLRFLAKPCMIHDFFSTAAELLASQGGHFKGDRIE